MTDVEPWSVEYAADDVERIFEQRKKFLNEAWSAASAYDTAITIAGYGAFFALWSAVSADITPAARTTTATMLGVSLLLYIGWTLLMMVSRHRFKRRPRDFQFASMHDGPNVFNFRRGSRPFRCDRVSHALF